MPLNKISVDAISANAVTNIAIANGTIVTVDLADQSVTGAKLGIGAVSGNNISGQITSNILASNLNISLTRILEEANINSIAVGGNVNIDVLNSTVHFFDAQTTANVTFNVRGNNTLTFDSITSVGEATTLAMAVKHGAVRHEANLFIDGVRQTLYYGANTKPAQVSISREEINLFNYSIFKTAPNTYRVITANVLFGLG